MATNIVDEYVNRKQLKSRQQSLLLSHQLTWPWHGSTRYTWYIICRMGFNSSVLWTGHWCEDKYKLRLMILINFSLRSISSARSIKSYSYFIFTGVLIARWARLCWHLSNVNMLSNIVKQCLNDSRKPRKSTNGRNMCVIPHHCCTEIAAAAATALMIMINKYLNFKNKWNT